MQISVPQASRIKTYDCVRELGCSSSSSSVSEGVDGCNRSLTRYDSRTSRLGLPSSMRDWPSRSGSVMSRYSDVFHIAGRRFVALRTASSTRSRPSFRPRVGDVWGTADKSTSWLAASGAARWWHRSGVHIGYRLTGCCYAMVAARWRKATHRVP